jgi:hypothetical protein
MADKLDIDMLFTICPPYRDLTNVIGQLDPEINLLKKLRNRETANIPRFPGGNEMVDFIVSQLYGDRLVASFSPYELLTKLHRTVTVKNKADQTLVYEESYPIHYGDWRFEKELIVKTKPTIGGERVESDYNQAVQNYVRTHASELAQQRPTFEDMIRINRRLILKNIRCIPCSDKTIKCFKFDWLNKQLL